MSTELARKLRKRMPPAEARIWNLLRVEPFRQFHFRRQVPIGRYYADFASHAAKLVVEVDGETHGSVVAQRYDADRDGFMRREGYSIIRVTNRDVMNNLEGVGIHLLAVLSAAPHPTFAGPSPQVVGLG
jgi:very-short-patch-repair endonuclease